MSGYAWEIKHKTKVIGHAYSYDAAMEIAYPHGKDGMILDSNYLWQNAGTTITPMLTDDANNYFEDLAKEFFGRDSESIDLSTLIRCGRWLDRHLFLTIDHNGSIWADDLFVGKVFRDDFRSIGDSAYDRGDVE